MRIPYATREQVAQSLEIAHTAYSSSLIDAKLGAASLSAEGFLHRVFYPERRTVLRDWPNYSSSPSWEVDLMDQELISLEAVISGGNNITANAILRRGDDRAEPPYNFLQVDLASSASFSAGSTQQRSLSILGLYGYNDTDTSVIGGLLSGGIDSDDTSIIITPNSGYYSPFLGVGSLLLMGTERLLLMNRTMVTSAQTTTASMVDKQSATIVATAGASTFGIGEIILIDGERMRIDDIAGTSLIVTRAFDGSTLDTHTSGSTIYAARRYTAARGVLGSTAASHSDGVSVYVHEYPALLNELVVAETVVLLEQNSSAYARTIGSGGSQREAKHEGLDDVRDRAFRALCRDKSRSASV